MKITQYKPLILAVAVAAGAALAPNAQANVELIISGGNSSSGVLFERATNLFNGNFTATFGLSSSTVRTYEGSIPGQTGLGTVTLDFILNGAIGGLTDILNQNPETTAAGTNTLPPTVVDSSTSPGAVGLNGSLLNSLPVYVVPYVFIKNIGASSTDSAGITNLTALQVAYLEGAGATIPATFFGGAGTNPVYFVGRNNQSAVRTEIDLNIGFTGTLQTYYTNGLAGSLPILDTTSTDAGTGDYDPGLTSGSTLYNTVLAISNSIGTVAVSNAKAGAARLSYNGVPYAYTNVINGSYALWFHEKYYYKNSGAGQLTPGQSTVLQLFYGSITNAAYTVSSVYTNSYIPEAAFNVSRTLDGGPITLK